MQRLDPQNHLLWPWVVGGGRGAVQHQQFSITFAMERLAFEFVRAWATPAGWGVRHSLAHPDESGTRLHDAAERRLSAHRIACPVLASMYRRGWLN
jgi:hypothetical protein